MTGSTAGLRNREGEAEYDVTWPWRDGPLAPGLTCVFRVKNEARNLPWVLPPMFEAVQHVVLVDNGSDDGTPEVARQVVESIGATDRFTQAAYPFTVSRAGDEHLHTPPDSVHSLTYFYNWSFAQVRTAYSMKWDGDMVLTREGVELLRDLSWQLRDSGAVVAIPRHPMTVESESVAWLDLGFRFLEPWVYPMGPEFTFVKASSGRCASSRRPPSGSSPPRACASSSSGWTRTSSRTGAAPTSTPCARRARPGRSRCSGRCRRVGASRSRDCAGSRRRRACT